MRRFVYILLLVGMAVYAGLAQSALSPTTFTPTVIIVSFDGFRWDYPTRSPASNLHRLMARGVHAEGLIPGFPSKTFPNHYTIVTGLYPGHHGIVANNILDSKTHRTFAPSKPKEQRDPMWWGGEPIWVTAQRAGQVAAAMFWPGTEAPIGGMLPRYWKPYDEEFPANARVAQVLRWMDLPEAERPTFVTLYFEDTDTAGHDDGPESKSVQAAIERDDGYLGRLLTGLEQRRILDRVNIVVVSDHGMAATSRDRVIAIDDYISLSDVEISDINPTIGIFPKAGEAESVYRSLAGAHPHLKVYRREETPAHWHYRDHQRIPPIIGVADEGWQVLRRSTLRDILAAKVRGDSGQHGYDPTVMSMRGIFVAAGPAFKQGITVPAFENVHIYNALAAALGVAPARNDGDPAVARSLLK